MRAAVVPVLVLLRRLMQSLRIKAPNPPAWQTHAHCSSVSVLHHPHPHSCLLHVRNSNVKQLDEQLDTMFNRWGFTTVFDVSSLLDNTLALRARIESNELRGPRILTVGDPFGRLNRLYVRDFLEENHIYIANTATPDQAMLWWRSRRQRREWNQIVCWFLSGGGSCSCPWPLPRRGEEAHRHSMPVFVHPQDVNGVNVAIDSGVDVLAHTVPQSPPWTPDFVLRLKRANLALIPR